MLTRGPRALAGSLVIAVATTLVVVAGTPVQAATVPTNYDSSTLAGNEAEQTIAVNPTDPQNVVTMATLLSRPAGLSKNVSTDGGKTWTSSIIGTGGALGEICCDEQMAFDRYGNLWVTYLLNTNGNVIVALSTDGGTTFKKVTEIVPTKPTGSRSPKNQHPKGDRFAASKKASGDQPSISTGLNSVWVSYTSFPTVQVQAAGARVTGLGEHGPFTAPETVPTAKGKGDFGSTAVGPSGQVLVAYQFPTGGQGGSRLYTALDPDGLGPAPFDNPRQLARSRVGGFDYIPAQNERSIDAEVSLAWDHSGGPHNGRAYAIWTQETKNESDNTDIMFQHSGNEGTSWTNAVRLNDDSTANSQFLPAIAVDQTTGEVGMSWYDARNDQGDGGPGDTNGIGNDDAQIWATYSLNGGATLVPNFRVSEGTSNATDSGSSLDYGDFTAAAFQSHRFYPVWSDNSNSTGTNPDGTLNELDIYTAEVTTP